MSAKVANPSSKENVFLFIPNLIGKVNKCTCLLLIQCSKFGSVLDMVTDR
ncbi:hypothetical protein RO3G_00088 [Rhizopus delemar RA 99-880]|uniref:Uncharacterized protein n=1 Tax=Rhizopus delemar (strain RA 99-880 / ATCC MYA-4621 / FGSC 9543 / NRRL 43880) TaxID=246409 RepID=I1BGQ4_RHIO9|nr:hypothetical protein RO3G_00088 [Rhizopus delemar RA 99-880]|eukprot:EIE75384.1 hypothetical protein RO3G_00088 [Rhizopus delemar RA 99-880]